MAPKKTPVQPEKHKSHKKHKDCSCKCKCKCNSNCKCNCELKYYFPLPNLPTQPVAQLNTNSWFAPGSVESCCAVCSSVKPAYTNMCNNCAYAKGSRPINNTAYFTTNQYIS